jgi:hypothetical protein
MKSECNEAFNMVGKWATPKSVKTSVLWIASAPKIASEPKGACLIIGVWNFPIVSLASLSTQDECTGNESGR